MEFAQRGLSLLNSILTAYENWGDKLIPIPAETLWKAQWISVLFIIIGWRIIFHESLGVCNGAPFPNYIEPFALFICGCYTCNFVLHFARILSILFRVNPTIPKTRNLQQDYAILTIVAIQIFCGFSTWNNKSGTCVDLVGIRTTPFLWLDWLCTKPLSVFMLFRLDSERNYMKYRECLLLAVSFTGFFSLFISILFHNIFAHIAVMIGNVSFVFSTYDTLVFMYIEYLRAKRKNELVLQERDKLDVLTLIKTQRDFRIALDKLTTAFFMLMVFLTYPINYFLTVDGYYGDEWQAIVILILNFLTQGLFGMMIADCNVQYYDSSQVAIMEQQRDAENLRSLFVRYIFHEVRVPLQTIVMGVDNLHFFTEELQYILQSLSLTNDVLNVLEYMEEASIAMQETLDDVLSYQKLGEGMLELEKGPAFVVDMILTAMNRLRGQYEKKNISVRYFVEDTIPEIIIVDHDRLEHVLTNLLSNAIKFSPVDASIEIYVKRTSSEDSTDLIRFEVVDHGMGIKQEDMVHLFTPFSQIPIQNDHYSKENHIVNPRSSSSGLGLSICKGFIELHQGTIGCTSKVRDINLSQPFTMQQMSDADYGSTFFFTIPIIYPTEAEIQAISVYRKNTASTEDGSDLIDESAEVEEDSMADEEVDYDRFVGSYHYGKRSDNDNNSQDDHHSMRTINEEDSQVLDHPDNESNAIHLIPSAELEDKDTIELLVTDTIHDDHHPQNLLENTQTNEDTKIINDEVTQSQTVTTNEYVQLPCFDYQQIQEILIVDDANSNIWMLQQSLRRKGFRSMKATDGISAIQMVVGDGQSDINRDGLQATRYLRDVGFKNMIVGLTGAAMEEEIFEFKSAGVDVVLTKPLRDEKLHQLLLYCSRYSPRSIVSDASDPTTKFEGQVADNLRKMEILMEMLQHPYQQGISNTISNPQKPQKPPSIETTTTQTNNHHVRRNDNSAQKARVATKNSIDEEKKQVKTKKKKNKKKYENDQTDQSITTIVINDQSTVISGITDPTYSTHHSHHKHSKF